MKINKFCAQAAEIIKATDLVKGSNLIHDNQFWTILHILISSHHPLKKKSEVQPHWHRLGSYLMFSTVITWLILFWLYFVCVDFKLIFLAKMSVLCNSTKILPWKICRNFSYKNLYSDDTTLYVHSAYDHFLWLPNNANISFKSIFFTEKHYQFSQFQISLPQTSKWKLFCHKKNTSKLWSTWSLALQACNFFELFTIY